MHSLSRMTIDIKRRDGVHWVFTNQADIACTKRSAVRCSASRMKDDLHPAKGQL